MLSFWISWEDGYKIFCCCFQHVACRHSLKVWSYMESQGEWISSGTQNRSTMQDRRSKWGCRREQGCDQAQEKFERKHGSTSLSHLMRRPLKQEYVEHMNFLTQWLPDSGWSHRPTAWAGTDSQHRFSALCHSRKSFTECFSLPPHPNTHGLLPSFLYQNSALQLISNLLTFWPLPSSVPQQQKKQCFI